MIRKTKQGYRVVSEKGKNLSKPNLSKAQAAKSLRQIEYFKHKLLGTKTDQAAIEHALDRRFGSER